ncbi:MAG TPA: VOC family protein [Steroidobacteraceae bacterium]|jgi:2,3-dihydroxybiphenyl 1,2-dioxygenase|nr:VOC family protein [Steroidobacteraceae bacterium]
MTISNLAYVGLGVADVQAWSRHAVGVYGLQPAAAAEGQVRLRLDDRAWRIGLETSPADDIAYIGFEVPDAGTAARLASSLQDEGASPKPLTPGECTGREIAGGIRVRDPDGLDIELIWGLAAAQTPFHSPEGVSFVTNGMGLGHAVISTADIGRALSFYQRLGLRVSDYISLSLGSGGDINVVFLHCNARHHTLALLPAPTPKRLNHLMFEVTTVDEVLKSYSRARHLEVPIVRHLGRHTNDHMLSFYARTPAGFDVEYGCGGRLIGTQWETAQYDRISIWGHEAS